MKNNYFIGFYLILILLFTGCASEQALYFSAPSELPNTERLMKAPGYWISLINSPDQLILNSLQVGKFNKNTQTLGLTKNIFSLFDEKDFALLEKEARETIDRTFEQFVHKKFYLKNGKVATSEFYAQIKKNMDVEHFDPSNFKLGIIVHFADHRFFPTSEALLEKKGDIDFDELQNSDLDVGIPVLILHESLDKQWYFVQSDLSSGWVLSKNLALCERFDLDFLLRKRQLAVVISPKADIFLDAELKVYSEYVRMGASFPIIDGNEKVVEIKLPVRSSDGTVMFERAFLKKEDTSSGFLDYTPRSIIDQAFKLLNAPYGWGGMYGEQDCSRFLQEVFATVGINLPRDSKDQAKIGTLVKAFDVNVKDEEKLDILKQAFVGATILPIKGHIMLYLGQVDGYPFAIHATWGYRERALHGDRVRVLNRVVVSDLSLGEGSKKGSLLRRLKSINIVQ